MINIYSKISRCKVSIYNLSLLFGLCGIVLLFIFQIKIAPYVLFVFLGFGWSLFFFRNYLNIVEIMLLSPLLSYCIFVSYASLCSFLGIQLTVFCAIIFVILSFSVFLFKKVFSSKSLNCKVSKVDILFCFILIIALVAKVVPIIGMYAPNLSDEITHAYYAKLIVDTGRISFFYSPGLHIISAYSNMLGGNGVVKQILYITNFFSAYSGVAIYIYIKRTFKDCMGALGTGLLFSLGVALTSLFYSAGKNAFIVGVSILPLFLLSINSNKLKGYSVSTILSVILLFALFMTHYPIALFACIYLASMFILEDKDKKKEILIISIGAVLGLIYLFCGYLKYNIGETLPLNGDFIVSLNTFISSLKNSLLVTFTEAKVFAFSGYPSFLFLGSIVGFFLVLAKTFKSNQSREYKVFLLWTIGCFLFYSLLRVFSLSKFSTLTETYILFLFFFSYTFLSFLASFLYRIISRYFTKDAPFYFFTITFTILTVYLGIRTYDSFVEKRENPYTTIVKEQDMKMFRWIEENLDHDYGIVTNGYPYNTLILPSDSGGWLPIFTENPISTPFWEFHYESTYSNFDYYLKLQENINNCEAINYFRSRGFRYYYQGSTPQAYNSLGTQEFLESNHWFLVHMEKGVFLYEIPSCGEID